VGGAVTGAVSQAWPPFVLVAGLLLIGAVCEADGLFAAVGTRVERLPGGPVALLAALLGLEAVVSALLNLDTAAVFATPIVLHAARQRRCDERPFLYGALFMANGASLLLPGSNLTNLIVLAHEPLSGADVARRMVVPWLVVVVLTIAFLAVVFPLREEGDGDEAAPHLHLGLGAVSTAAATALTLALRNPALPVLAVGVAAVGIRRLRPRIGVPVLGSLFLVAVALGTLARRWHGPASLLRHLDAPATAAVAAGASIAVNNLPAASLLSAVRPPHPLELLIGLDLGPNLAFTGSLSTYLWYHAARASGARPSLALSSLLGLALVPLTVLGALLGLRAT
jgi:arsenical pump membrane protein